jgi:hypothetical protein
MPNTLASARATKSGMAAVGTEMSFLILPPPPFCAREKEPRNRQKSRAWAREPASLAFSRMFASPAFSRTSISSRSAVPSACSAVVSKRTYQGWLAAKASRVPTMCFEDKVEGDARHELEGGETLPRPISGQTEKGERAVEYPECDKARGLFGGLGNELQVPQ